MKQIIKPVSEPIEGSLLLNGSKSLVNRVLIMAALAQGKSTISNMLFCDDTIACIHALKALGIIIEIDEKNQKALVNGCRGLFNQMDAKINCHDSGTLTRLLLPICAAIIGGRFYFFASDRMSSRPIENLLEVLINQGSNINFEKNQYQMPFFIHSNGLIGGEVYIQSHQSSQFLSGLLLASPFAKSDVTISTKTNRSLPYVA